MRFFHLAARFALPVLVGIAAACATAPRDEVYIFHGPAEFLEKLSAEGQKCGYQGIERAFGSHLEDIVVLPIPRHPTAEFQCVLDWAVAHQHEGLTNQFSPNY